MLKVKVTFLFVLLVVAFICCDRLIHNVGIPPRDSEPAPIFLMETRLITPTVAEWESDFVFYRDTVNDVLCSTAFWLVPFFICLYLFHRLRFGKRADWVWGCRYCGYQLSGLSEPRCPECGKGI